MDATTPQPDYTLRDEIAALAKQPDLFPETKMLLEAAMLTLAPRTDVDALQEKLDALHKEFAASLNRRVAVEEALLEVGMGRVPMLTRDECLELAFKLGVPDEMSKKPKKLKPNCHE